MSEEVWERHISNIEEGAYHPVDRQDYVFNMRMIGEFVDHLTIQAMANALNVHIDIYTAGQGPDQRPNRISSPHADNGSLVLKLRYSNGNHYEALWTL